MIELAAAIAIVLADWGAGASHMCYLTRIGWIMDTPEKQFSAVDTSDIRPVRMPFYNKPMPIWGDRWHFIAAWRYLPMALLAWMAFGYQWEWWVGTALVNSIGWYGLKVAHGKVDRWGWQPRWLKQVLGR